MAGEFYFKLFMESLGTTLNALKPRIAFSFAVAAWILLYVNARGLAFLPTVVVVSAVIVAILCTCLTLTNLLAYIWSITTGLRKHFAEMFHHYRDKKRIQMELDYLTLKERKIIAYLLAKEQRLFEVLPDGEEAKTLIAKGIVVWTVRKPPAIHRDITVEVPAHVWDVLVKNRAKFPYEAPQKPEANPWRTHWAAR
jgi:hypothetical protein